MYVWLCDNKAQFVVETCALSWYIVHAIREIRFFVPVASMHCYYYLLYKPIRMNTKTRSRIDESYSSMELFSNTTIWMKSRQLRWHNTYMHDHDCECEEGALFIFIRIQIDSYLYLSWIVWIVFGSYFRQKYSCIE